MLWIAALMVWQGFVPPSACGQGASDEHSSPHVHGQPQPGASRGGDQTKLRELTDQMVLMGQVTREIHEKFQTGEIYRMSREQFESLVQTARQANSKISQVFTDKQFVQNHQHEFMYFEKFIQPKLEDLGRVREQFEKNQRPPGPEQHKLPAPIVIQGVNQVTNGSYETGKEIAPKDPRLWSASARNYGSQGSYAAAGRDWSHVIELEPNNAEAWTGVGVAAYHQGDLGGAAKCARHALELDPSNKGALALSKLTENVAPTLSMPKVLDANKAISQEGQAGMPGTAMLPGAPGMSPAEIAAEAQRQANAPPSAVQQSAAIAQQGVAAMAVHDYSKAKDLFTQAIALNGRNAEACNDRAIAFNKLGQYDNAIHDASFALGLAPGNAAALQTRSWAFAQSGQYKEALADANYSMERDPSNAYAFYNRAFALAGLQEHDGSIDSLKKAAELDPRFQPTYDQALQMPKDADLTFLFSDVGAKKASPVEAPAAAGQQKRFAHLMLISVLGGTLVVLGLLHIFSPRWRQTVHATLRRIAGGSAGAEPANNADGFWGGYTVTRELGSGGMGVVYEAMDHALARRVAIKKMRDELRANPEERRRFLAEARTVAALHHPNIADIYSIVEDSGDIYLVFEYVDGPTIHQLLGESGPLALADAQRIMREACEAVTYAHRQGVIHRDLKPANIMLASDGRVKVMDFGVARQAQEALSRAAQTNTVVGTPPYMAPEQEQGIVRRESDVFALGVCLYEMLSGRLPFAGQGAGMLLNKMSGQHVPLSQLVPGLPAAADAVMAKALHPDPERRYRTPGELSAALQGLA